jgi:DNA segregation ATPase FtsK/SpoIIIE-like protein
MPLDILKPLIVYNHSESDVKSEIDSIEMEPNSLKIPAKVIGITHGLRVTRYELLPNKGINISSYKRYKANFQAA